MSAKKTKAAKKRIYRDPVMVSAMAAAGLTSKQLSIDARVNPATVSRLLQRQHEPRLETAERIAAALHVPVDFILRHGGKND